MEILSNAPTVLCRIYTDAARRVNSQTDGKDCGEQLWGTGEMRVNPHSPLLGTLCCHSWKIETQIMIDSKAAENFICLHSPCPSDARVAVSTLNERFPWSGRVQFLIQTITLIASAHYHQTLHFFSIKSPHCSIVLVLPRLERHSLIVIWLQRIDVLKDWVSSPPPLRSAALQERQRGRRLNMRICGRPTATALSCLQWRRSSLITGIGFWGGGLTLPRPNQSQECGVHQHCQEAESSSGIVVVLLSLPVPDNVPPRLWDRESRCPVSPSRYCGRRTPHSWTHHARLSYSGPSTMGHPDRPHFGQQAFTVLPGQLSLCSAFSLPAMSSLLCAWYTHSRTSRYDHHTDTHGQHLLVAHTADGCLWPGVYPARWSSLPISFQPASRNLSSCLVTHPKLMMFWWWMDGLQFEALVS